MAVTLRLFVLLVAMLVLAPIHTLAARDEHDDDDDDMSEDYSSLTFGCAIRLRHGNSGYHLHSHGINYGSGSGQQSVTGVSQDDDPNSLWQIREAYGQPHAAVGGLVTCGAKVRVRHVLTHRWLHSHLHSSPLSHRQEVSGYGDGEHSSDTGDDWLVECPTLAPGASIPLDGKTSLSFLHADTQKRLYTRRNDEFTQSNCRNCPIVGQLELSAHSVSIKDSNGHFILTDSGILFPAARQA